MTQNTTPEKKCCPACSGSLRTTSAYTEHCNNTNCKCHTTQEEADWEKEFDEEFNLKYQERVNHGYFAGNEKIADVKAFIRRTRQQAVAEDRKALRRKVEFMRRQECDCLSDEGLGYHTKECDFFPNGFNAALHEVAALLTSQDDEN